MPSITGFFRVIRENPKKIVFFGGVAYLIADYARSRWHRMEHREAFCREARHYGQMSLHPEALPRRMFILLHPRAGPGENRGFFEKEVAPIFHLAGLDYDVRRIKHTEEVRDIVFSQDLSKYDDVVIVGGDGFFQEAMSGLLQRPDAQDVTSSKGLGLVPVGNSNNLFRTRLAQSQETDRALLAHEAALGIVEGRSKAIDAIQIEFADTVMPSFAFSSVGWGLFGGAAARGQNRRWPNQSRYDVGALSGLLWDYSKTSDCQAAVRVNDAQSSQRHHPALLATINAFWASGSRRVVDDEPAAGLTVVDLPETTGLGSLLARLWTSRSGNAFASGADEVQANCQQVVIEPEMQPAAEDAEDQSPTHPVPFWIDGTNYLARPCVLSYIPNCARVYTASRLELNSSA